jgi:hypothetical protein
MRKGFLNKISADRKYLTSQDNTEKTKVALETALLHCPDFKNILILFSMDLVDAISQ